MSKPVDERTRLIALAHLKNGKKPAEVGAELDISYAAALKLNKQLKAAEEQDEVRALFNVPQATMESLIHAAKSELAVAGDLLEAEDVNEAVDYIQNSAKGLDILESELQRAAQTLAREISLAASTSSSSDTLVNLADALSKLQLAFFAKGTNVQVNNYNEATFEKYLTD